MNPNLLKITSIPISIEVNVTNASLKASENKEPLRVDISTTPGGFRMQSQPAQIKVDSYEVRASMGYGEYNAGDFNQKEADKGWKIAYQGVARIIDEGNQLARGVSPSAIAAQQMRAGASIETITEFLPKGIPDVSFDKGKLSLNYTPSDVNIDWENLMASPVEFVPGNIEFIIKERARVEIEYTGGPIYVPASADPNYEPKFEAKG